MFKCKLTPECVFNHTAGNRDPSTTHCLHHERRTAFDACRTSATTVIHVLAKRQRTLWQTEELNRNQPALKFLALRLRAVLLGYEAGFLGGSFQLFKEMHLLHLHECTCPKGSESQLIQPHPKILFYYYFNYMFRPKRIKDSVHSVYKVDLKTSQCLIVMWAYITWEEQPWE
jgi:hypothetical protein